MPPHHELEWLGATPELLFAALSFIQETHLGTEVRTSQTARISETLRLPSSFSLQKII